jgi:hypothetical protein
MLCFADAAARSMGGKNPSPLMSVRTKFPSVHGVREMEAICSANSFVCTGAGRAGTR